MTSTLARGLVGLTILAGCGPTADQPAIPLSTSAYWALQDNGQAVTAAPWNRPGRDTLGRQPQATYSPSPLGMEWRPSGGSQPPIARPWDQRWHGPVLAPAPSVSPPQPEPGWPKPVDIGGGIGDGTGGDNPAAPPGWKPEWGRPIDPGIGDGTIPDSWRQRRQPWPRPTPPVTPPPYGGWPGQGTPSAWPGQPGGGPPWPQPTPVGTPVPRPGYSQALVAEFQQLDGNGDGVLSEPEYVAGKMAQIRYFRAPTEAENEQMRQRLRAEFRQGDVNGDGRLTLDEFANNPVFHTQ